MTTGSERKRTVFSSFCKIKLKKSTFCVFFTQSFAKEIKHISLYFQLLRCYLSFRNIYYIIFINRHSNCNRLNRTSIITSSNSMKLREKEEREQVQKKRRNSLCVKRTNRKVSIAFFLLLYAPRIKIIQEYYFISRFIIMNSIID